MFMVRRLVVVLSVLLGLSLAVPATASARPAPRYYLSLGDSLAFGYQPDTVARGDLNAAHYRSYAEDYTLFHPGLKLVNYGCPGETTTTLLSGGCPWLLQPTATLHDSFGSAGSQLAAAQQFLTAHRGQVSLISVDIGSNDLLALVNSCKTSPDLMTCIGAGLPATLTTMGTNYGKLVGTLRALAPNATIVLFNFYNPLVVTIPGSDQLATLASGVVDKLAATFHASVADAFRAINADGSRWEQASVCLLTWMCTSYQNIHPNALGYWALTLALQTARPVSS